MKMGEQMDVCILEAELIGLGRGQGGAGRDVNQDDFLRSGPGSWGRRPFRGARKNWRGLSRQRKGKEKGRAGLRFGSDLIAAQRGGPAETPTGHSRALCSFRQRRATGGWRSLGPPARAPGSERFLASEPREAHSCSSSCALSGREAFPFLEVSKMQHRKLLQLPG